MFDLTWRRLAALPTIGAAVLISLLPGQLFAQGAAAECVPLAEQYPDLGTEQSISARTTFTTVWGSYELPGGPCGYASAQVHYEALLADAKRRGGPTRHTVTSLPDWSGHWGTENSTGELAIVGLNSTTEGMAARPPSGAASTSRTPV